MPHKEGERNNGDSECGLWTAATDSCLASVPFLGNTHQTQTTLEPWLTICKNNTRLEL